ncbi:sigma 54-interacting transcriptional regulator [Anaerospora sp.]|jgi:PAS domain S-box-containing protein|uniref:sigma 54-interacting transcriptional regulator n=1 Tax=Anaerospora sp. TaxID=1960278 RepID=UPI00289BC371|nr:sigma 54-interacting transcriptional regulator [Anaerospora sp.]
MKISDIMIRIHPILAADIVSGRTDIKAPKYIDFFPVVDEQQKYMGTIRKEALLAVQNCSGGRQSVLALIEGNTPIVSKTDDIDYLPDTVNQAVVVDDNQQVVGIVTAARLMRMLKKNLNEFKDQFSAVINSAQNGILAVDSQGRIIIANRAVEEILELQNSNIIGHPVTEVIANTLMPVILESGKPLLGQKISLGKTMVMANYSPIISDNEVVGAVSVFQDISLLENTSSELNYVKGLMYELEAIINSSYDGMFITDAKGNVLRVNKAYERIAGIKATEILGKDMRQLVEAHYYNQSVTLLVMEKGESITINQTVKNDRKILVTGNPVFDAEGNLFRVVTNVRDITELSQLQEQLSKTKEQTLKYETELSHLRSMQLKAQEIIFRSNSMTQAIATATKIAEVDSTVLITGESGTGKELIAKLIHKRGKGITKPFIKINCAALPEHLLESELFGYETGAFTGAKKEGKPGLFELAHNGTLFLDEVGDMPLILQAKLLRAIQDKEFMRVGGTKSIKVNVRIIAATHRNLANMAKEGSFRTDLYYRLVVVPIHLPPLRDRKEDIPLLIIHFLDKFNKRFGYSKTIGPDVIDKLADYSWPGNVRELENIIERMMVTATVEELSFDCLPESFKIKSFLPKRGTKLKTAVEQVETFLLSETYKECQSWQKVAEALDIDRATVYRKAKHYGLLKG